MIDWETEAARFIIYSHRSADSFQAQYNDTSDREWLADHHTSRLVLKLVSGAGRSQLESRRPAFFQLRQCAAPSYVLVHLRQ
jgi:hypothetical protein